MESIDTYMYKQLQSLLLYMYTMQVYKYVHLLDKATAPVNMATLTELPLINKLLQRKGLFK